MAVDFSLWQYGVLAILGVAAGVINVLAGGGSNLILPVLMIFGVPADVANGTNRVGVLMQSVVGIKGFHAAGRLPTHDLRGILTPMLAGGLCGAVLAAFLPNVWLKLAAGDHAGHGCRHAVSPGHGVATRRRRTLHCGCPAAGTRMVVAVRGIRRFCAGRRGVCADYGSERRVAL